MKKRTVTLGLIQSTPGPDFQTNLCDAVALVVKAAEKGAQIICLPELYRSPYFPQKDKLKAARFAETIPGESTKAFAMVAKKYGVVVAVPLFEKAGSRFFNSVAVLDADGKLLDTYRKVHIPHDPLFYEKSYFEPGNRGFKVFRTKFGNFSVLICYDQWFPEAARSCKLAGAELIFYPTAIGFVKNYKAPEGDWRDAWMTIQRGHAIANSIHVAPVNRVGGEGELKFWGTSFVADAFGNIVKQGSTAKEEIVLAKVDLSTNKSVGDGWGFMRNRRPDAYSALVKK
jgi:agmatine deiminase